MHHHATIAVIDIDVVDQYTLIDLHNASFLENHTLSNIMS